MVANGKTNLENRLRIRPAGVVSKKLMGLLKIAKAIRSCSFRDAYNKKHAKLGSRLLTVAAVFRRR